jgi:hypothetical protein
VEKSDKYESRADGKRHNSKGVDIRLVIGLLLNRRGGQENGPAEAI